MPNARMRTQCELLFHYSGQIISITYGWHRKLNVETKLHPKLATVAVVNRTNVGP